MNELEEVDQALFGYSDGHRQIAASIRLPSHDLYQLSAATDLAAGVQLGPNESYLTGLPLAESRRFALIRTWSAFEMPRPGCVWSHVLLIDFNLLASQADLSHFVPLLKRPNRLAHQRYRERLALDPDTRGLSSAPDCNSVFRLIRTYYSGEPVVLSVHAGAEPLEAAIMAVWSQQWPRLRNSFSFRTAVGGERRRNELVNYDVQVRSGPPSVNDFDAEEQALSPAQNWIVAATNDALVGQVPPLRRFLWRYGRDLLDPRAHFRMIVRLYLSTEGEDECPPEGAIKIFKSLPSGADGETLKRDILGVAPVSLPLCPPLSQVGLLQLLATAGDIGSLLTPEQMKERFAVIPPDQIRPIAMFLDQHNEVLSRWEPYVDDGLVASAGRRALIEDLPPRIRRLILFSRPDLIDTDTAATLSDGDLLELTLVHAHDALARILVGAVVHPEPKWLRQPTLRRYARGRFRNVH